jgi:hypothetical protein
MQRHRIGSYGAGTLWSARNQGGDQLILFNETPIAKRAGRPKTPQARDWVSLDSAWKVTSVHGSEVCVQHNGGEGVFVSLNGAVGK